MSITKISISFEDTGKGQADVSILGPDGYDLEYSITKNDVHKPDLEDGIYTIKVVGTSGTTTDLSVTDPTGTSLLADTAAGPKINMNDNFTVDSTDSGS